MFGNTAEIAALPASNNNNYQTGLFGNNNNNLFSVAGNNNNSLFSNNNQQNNNDLFGNQTGLFSNNQYNNNNTLKNNSVRFGFIPNTNYNNNNNSLFGNSLIESFKAENHSKIKSNRNNIFDITIKNLTNFIEINACYQDEFRKNEYNRRYDLKELKNIKVLTICDTIDEIYEELIYVISKNTPIIYENNTEINISVPISHSKYKNIFFTLDKKIKTENEIKDELYDIIAKLHKKLKNFESEKKDLFCSYQKEIDELKQSISFYCEQVNQENKKYKDMLEKNQKLEEKISLLEKEISILKTKNF